jgi:MFS family permease
MTAGPTSMSRGALVALLVANAVSVAGTRLSAVAVPWLVLVTTGSAAKTGIVAVAELAPMVLAKAVAGPLIDRIGARRVSIWADSISAGLVAAIPVLHAAGALSFGSLVGLIAFAGTARGPGDTAKTALAPDVAEASGLPIDRITGLTATVDRCASIVAPALAGVTIAAVGPADALALDAVSFAICALGVARWVARAHRPTVSSERAGYAAEFRAGAHFLIGDHLMRGLVLMVCVTNLLDTAYSSVLLPVWIRSNGYGPAQLGILGSAFGVAATAGSIIASVCAQRLPRRTTYLVGFLIAGAPRYLALAWGAPIPALLGVGVVAGFGAGFINPILSSVFVERIPRAMLGRVSSLAESVSWAGMPVGAVVAGAAVTAIGLTPVFLIAGVIYAVATTLPGLLPQWHELDRTGPGAEEFDAMADRETAAVRG